MKLKVQLQFQSYIAQPYWAEQNQLIDIDKQSGKSRARSEDKREQALLRYLEKIGMSPEQYKALQKKAAEKWHKDITGKIVIPSERIGACLVNGTRSAPAGCRVDP